ncbi:class I SAM-dependent methyltransferase [Stratiformator vulcanicus]|uniref:Methyltransferase type 11 domain-containing protein n=1 Tax=Stratiformator vulcanicus TaxID=2527980 RepID=A0A517QVT9_9PLAN|nr:methyltransferase domain-containing protein [Stratiformator vulcanicus]QDT35772.1 hypothetical protein Pan189_01250 [Stratiformator vulcanicus]
MLFKTRNGYTDRVSKARYVWEKYKPILHSRRILDVGADEQHLRQHIDSEAEYVGIGLGGSPDHQVNLEREAIPFGDGSFDCVLCLDVLEHLDNPHEVFDELCRVTRSHVIISLPNPWGDMFRMLRFGPYRPDFPLKFYGLPPEPPEDRHKWFFSAQEARAFIEARAVRNGLEVLQLDREGEGVNIARGVRNRLRRGLYRKLFHESVDLDSLMGGPTWAVLEKIKGRTSVEVVGSGVTSHA